MKKVIGILGVAVFAMAMFLNVNLSNEKSTLASFDLNSALAKIHCDAEVTQGEHSVGISVDLTSCYNTNCVCKSGSCNEANWISFRSGCGNTEGLGSNGNTDANCAVNSSGGNDSCE